jgi:hypothetical protein
LKSVSYGTITWQAIFLLFSKKLVHDATDPEIKSALQWNGCSIYAGTKKETFFAID